MQIEIRNEIPEDAAAIRGVNNRAFGQQDEGKIIDALRANGGVLLSLVAILDREIIGHIMYSPATIGEVPGAGLGPMAIVPEYQRRGIGSRLIETGNRTLKDRGCPFIVVLGHANFYPRFGFRPAHACGIRCEWEVPDDVFMILMLDQNKMAGATGLARYRQEFSVEL